MGDERGNIEELLRREDMDVVASLCEPLLKEWDDRSATDDDFDPIALANLFRDTTRQLLLIQHDTKQEIALLSRRSNECGDSDYARAIREHQETCEELSAQLEGVQETFGRLGTTSVRVGRRLHDIGSQKRRALAAIDLIQYFDEFVAYGDAEEAEILSSVFTDPNCLDEAARLLRPLVAIATELEAVAAASAEERRFFNMSISVGLERAMRGARHIHTKAGAVENALLDRYDESCARMWQLCEDDDNKHLRDQSLRCMRDTAATLCAFNGGRNLFRRYVFRVVHERLVREYELCEQTVRLTSPNIIGERESSFCLIEKSMSSPAHERLSKLFDAIYAVCEREFCVVQRVFPPKQWRAVTVSLLERTFQDPAVGVQTRLEELLAAPQALADGGASERLDPELLGTVKDFLLMLCLARHKAISLERALTQCALCQPEESDERWEPRRREVAKSVGDYLSTQFDGLLHSHERGLYINLELWLISRQCEAVVGPGLAALTFSSYKQLTEMVFSSEGGGSGVVERLVEFCRESVARCCMLFNKRQPSTASLRASNSSKIFTRYCDVILNGVLLPSIVAASDLLPPDEYHPTHHALHRVAHANIRKKAAAKLNALGKKSAASSRDENEEQTTSPAGGAERHGREDGSDAPMWSRDDEVQTEERPPTSESEAGEGAMDAVGGDKDSPYQTALPHTLFWVAIAGVRRDLLRVRDFFCSVVKAEVASERRAASAAGSCYRRLPAMLETPAENALVKAHGALIAHCERLLATLRQKYDYRPRSSKGGAAGMASMEPTAAAQAVAAAIRRFHGDASSALGQDTVARELAPLWCEAGIRLQTLLFAHIATKCKVSMEGALNLSNDLSTIAAAIRPWLSRDADAAITRLRDVACVFMVAPDHLATLIDELDTDTADGLVAREGKIPRGAVLSLIRRRADYKSDIGTKSQWATQLLERERSAAAAGTVTEGRDR